MSSAHPSTLRHFDTLEQASYDMKVLRYLSDEGLRVARAAEVNIDTLAALSRQANRIASSRKHSAATGEKVHLINFTEGIDEVRHKHVTHARVARSLVAQAESVLNQVHLCSPYLLFF